MYEQEPEDIRLHKEKMSFIARIFPQKQASVLDIGCYEGQLGTILKDKGYDYYGIDIDLSVLQTAKSNKLNVRRVNIERERIPFSFKFDYIVMLDVLEHLHDPQAAIKKAKEKLKSKGVLFISLPNDFHLLNRLRFLLGKPISPAPFWPHGHLHIFTRAQAAEFLEQQNLKILKTYELPGTFPGFLSFHIRRKISNVLSGLLSRSTLYITKSE